MSFSDTQKVRKHKQDRAVSMATRTVPQNAGRLCLLRRRSTPALALPLLLPISQSYSAMCSWMVYLTVPCSHERYWCTAAVACLHLNLSKIFVPECDHTAMEYSTSELHGSTTREPCTNWTAKRVEKREFLWRQWTSILDNKFLVPKPDLYYISKSTVLAWNLMNKLW